MTSEEQQYDMNKERVLKYLKQEIDTLEKERDALLNKIIGFQKAIDVLEYKDVK